MSDKRRWTSAVVLAAMLFMVGCADGIGIKPATPPVGEHLQPQVLYQLGQSCATSNFAIPLGAKDTITAAVAGFITWVSSNTSVATVSWQGNTGTITAVGYGEACITASGTEAVQGLTSRSSKLTVVAPVVTTITVSPGSPSVTVGSTTVLTATAREQQNNPMSGVSFSWSSSNTSIATVSSGTVTGVGVGQATITASASGINGSVSVTSNLPGHYVSITPQVYTLYAPSNFWEYTSQEYSNESSYPSSNHLWQLRWNASESWQTVSTDPTYLIDVNCVMSGSSFTLRLTLSRTGWQTNSIEWTTAIDGNCYYDE